jgi:hypothetical protein
VQTLLTKSANSLPSTVKLETLDTEFDKLGCRTFFYAHDFTALRLTGDSRAIIILDHYGDVRGGVNLPICYDWFGEAISDIDSKSHANAPCQCDPPATHLARRWDGRSNRTWEYTKRFVRDSKMYGMKEYGKMCLKHHNCKKWGKQGPTLDLSPSKREQWTTHC